MCRVKLRNEIKSEQDVQNLITAIILRQRGLYTKDYLVAATEHYLPDRTERVVVSTMAVKDMIDNTLSIFRANGKVTCDNGQYKVISAIDK